MHPRHLLIVGLLLCCLAPGLARAQVTEDQKLLPTEPGEFGFAVALVETDTEALALIGAPGDGERGDDAGAVYAYRYDEGAGAWALEAKLWPEAAGESSLLGTALAVSADGRVAVAGGRSAGSDTAPLFGRAFVFERTDGAWAETATLGASDEVARDGFGAAVALSADGEVLGVGAPAADGSFPLTGAVYVFRRETATGGWAQEAKVSTERACFFNRFGRAVAVSAAGDRVVVGEPCGEGGDPPALHVFARSGDPDGPNGGWEREALLDPMNGSAVAMSAEGDLVLAGHLFSSTVVVLEREGEEWSETGRITSSGGSPTNFGRHAIVLQEDLALIGDLGADIQDNSEGAAFLFRRSEDGAWAEEAKLVASDGEEFDWFGGAVALSERFVLVGAFGDDGLGSQTGAAYAFDLGRVVLAEPQPTPAEALVLAAYPNPFVSALTVAYALPRAGRVRLAVYDVSGARWACSPRGGGRRASTGWTSRGAPCPAGSTSSGRKRVG